MKVVFITSVFEFGIQSLKAMIAQGEDIVAVIIPPVDPGDSRGQAVKALASDSGIPVYEWKSVNKAENLEIVREMSADLAVSAGNMKFVFKRPFLDSFTHGAINYHCSLLPENGGMYPINWQILKGLDYVGITIHQCDEHIDTGELILQKKVPIGPNEGFKAVYFGRVLKESVDLLNQAVEQVRLGTVVRTRQDHTKSTYNPPLGPEHWTINWSDEVGKIYNAIRAFDAWPGAQTTFRGKQLKIWQAKLEHEFGSDCVPGEIIGLSEESFIVAGMGGCLRVERIQWEKGSKQMAAEFFKTAAPEVGEVLG